LHVITAIALAYAHAWMTWHYFIGLLIQPRNHSTCSHQTRLIWARDCRGGTVTEAIGDRSIGHPIPMGKPTRVNFVGTSFPLYYSPPMHLSLPLHSSFHASTSLHSSFVWFTSFTLFHCILPLQSIP